MPQREDAYAVGASECPLCGYPMDGYLCRLACPNCGYKEDCSDTFMAGPMEPPKEERDDAAAAAQRPES